MKKVLILCIGCSLDPWKKMYHTSLETWDSIDVEGVETTFYFGQPIKENTNNTIYFPIKEGYENMGHKMLAAFEWALKNKEFDYVARINSSCYVDKKELIKYVQSLPEKELFAGGEVIGAIPKWMFGGLQFLISRDIIQKFVDNKNLFNHNLIEDVALSYLANDLNIPYTAGKGCSINEIEAGYNCIGYGSDSIEFTDFHDLIPLKHFFYRCKIDRDRNQDKIIMKNLFEILK